MKDFDFLELKMSNRLIRQIVETNVKIIQTVEKY